MKCRGSIKNFLVGIVMHWNQQLVAQQQQRCSNAEAQIRLCINRPKHSTAQTHRRGRAHTHTYRQTHRNVHVQSHMRNVRVLFAGTLFIYLLINALPVQQPKLELCGNRQQRAVDFLLATCWRSFGHITHTQHGPQVTWQPHLAPTLIDH